MRQLIKSFTGLVGLALFAYLFVFYAAEGTKAWTAQRSGQMQSSVNRLSDSTLVFDWVDLRDFPEPPIPRVGDTLIAIGDSAATRAIFRRYLDSPFTPGTEVPLTFLQEGRPLRATLRTSLPSSRQTALVWVLQSVRFLTTLLFVSVALWAFFKRPDSAGVRTLALFSFAMAAFLMGSVRVMDDSFATFHIPLRNTLSEILNNFSVLFGAFWLNLAFLFPQPHGLMRRRPLLAYALCYTPYLLLLLVVYLHRLVSEAPTPSGWGRLILIVIAVQVVAGLAILAGRYRRTEDRIERRQTRLVLWGTGASLLGLVLLIVSFWGFQRWFSVNPNRALIVINVAFLGLLVSPASFAYSFNRYRLLEVEGRLRRGTRYMAAFIVVVGLLAGIGLAGGVLLRRLLGETGGNLALFLAVLSAFGVVPLLRWARTRLERVFYPERLRLRELIRSFLTRAGSLADQRAFWEQLEDRLRDGLAIEGVFPVLRAGDNGRFLLRDDEITPFGAESELVSRLARDPRPLMVDEVIASRALRLGTEEVEWIARHRVALVLPLVARGQLIGFLALGSKTESEDYAPEELRILDSLMTQVAVATENMRLLEENVDKRRLEEQLQMARRIQHGFLPRQIPETPGLELAATTRFCLEVAGDYYDIILREGGETVLAVGDVSGKGAGAALLMANLQASLRTAVGVGAPLPEVVARINDLIVSNTPPEDYITFFVAVFDPRRRTLTYVNAGHNPPLLRRADGTISPLDEGGLILGMMSGVSYEQGTVSLSPGDDLLLYTDGVSEAMNAQEEEFGEQRLRAFLASCRGWSPSECLSALEEQVLAHRGSAALEDDFTLLFARVK